MDKMYTAQCLLNDGLEMDRLMFFFKGVRMSYMGTCVISRCMLDMCVLYEWDMCIDDGVDKMCTPLS
jgi:hypothetical protein